MATDTWVDEARVEFLKQLWADGHSASICAERIKRRFGCCISRNAVISKIHRLGLAGRATWPQHEATKRAVNRRRKKAAKPVRFAVKKSPLAELLGLPLPEEPKDEIARTTIVDRERDQCAWVIGEPRELKCCGAPIIPGLKSPYCLDHARRAYSLPTVERREFILPDIQEAIARKQARQAGEILEKEKEAA